MSADARVLVAFIVTVADVTIVNIGATFSGLVFGFAVSWLLERHLEPLPTERRAAELVQGVE